jgi:hypothetical protein
MTPWETLEMVQWKRETRYFSDFFLKRVDWKGWQERLGFENENPVMDSRDGFSA